MTTAELILKNVGTIGLVLGLGFSVYHNVKNNTTQAKDNKAEIQLLRENTASFIATIDKMFSYVVEVADKDKEFDTKVKSAHQHAERVKEELDVQLKDIREKYVSHHYCDKAMENKSA